MTIKFWEHGNLHTLVDIVKLRLERTGGSVFEIKLVTPLGNTIKLLDDTSGKLDSILITKDTNGETMVVIEGKGVKRQ